MLICMHVHGAVAMQFFCWHVVVLLACSIFVAIQHFCCRAAFLLYPLLWPVVKDEAGQLVILVALEKVSPGHSALV